MKEYTTRTANFKLLWVMRDTASLGWVSQKLGEMSHLATGGTVMTEFFVTGQPQPEERLPLGIYKGKAEAGDR